MHRLQAVAVGQVVAVTNTFIAHSPSALEALKSATLLKSLRLNTLITGQVGTGKKTLARYIFPHAPIINAIEYDTLLTTIKENQDVIIVDFEKLPNTEIFKNVLEVSSSKIVAISKIKLPEQVYNQFFTLSIEIPPLKERKEDIKPLCQMFLREYAEIIGEGNDDICDKISLDIENNAHSLKRSLLVQALFKSMGAKELMSAMERYLLDHLEGENAYRDNLPLFDIPLINAGLKKYKSQLKLSEVLGINRNTLRKKITQNSKDIIHE